VTKADHIRKLLAECTDEEVRQLLDELHDRLGRHPLEELLNAKADVILEALHRGSDLSIRGIRGLIGEATFAVEIAPTLQGWRDVTPPGNHAYDTALADNVGTIRVQTKMQRRREGKPWIRDGRAIVEVQRTRTGTKAGEATRPYRFGEFDILAVCMEPSLRSWRSFMYIPERWLLPRPEDPLLIRIMQPVSLTPDDVWTDNFNIAVARFRSNEPRPQA
jgi:hypothetical protein